MKGDLSVLEFGYVSRSGEADFVQTILLMHHHDMSGAQLPQHFSHRTAKVVEQTADAITDYLSDL